MKIRMTTRECPRPSAVLLAVCLALALVPAAPAPSRADLTVTPASAKALVRKDTRVNLTWTLTGVAADTWSSSQGVFEEPAGSLGTNPVPLSIVVGGSGSGSVSESLVIPASIADPGSRTGAAGNFTYRRDFMLPTGGPAESVSLAVILTFPSQAAGPVSVRRVELYFEEEGRRTNEVSVGRNAKGLTVLADIQVDGTGYIEGYWEVDGRRLENVRANASFGSRVTVRSSAVPGLPTFRPGLHSVRLVITEPAPGFPLPRIGYIVTSHASEKLRSLVLIAPENGEEVNGDTMFRWTRGPETSYAIVYKSQTGEEPVLKAQTKEPSYRIPTRLLTERFVAGTNYTWRVEGYDSEGNLVSRGGPWMVVAGE